MRKAIIVAAAIVLMVTGIALVKARTQSVVLSSPAIATFELMSNVKDLPVAPHPDAF